MYHWYSESVMCFDFNYNFIITRIQSRKFVNIICDFSDIKHCKSCVRACERACACACVWERERERQTDCAAIKGLNITSSWSSTVFSLTSLTVSRGLSALLSRLLGRLQCWTNSGDFVVWSLWLSSSRARSTDIRNWSIQHKQNPVMNYHTLKYANTKCPCLRWMQSSNTLCSE